jgi:hypothetical protein
VNFKALDDVIGTLQIEVEINRLRAITPRLDRTIPVWSTWRAGVSAQNPSMSDIAMLRRLRALYADRP